MSNAAFFLRWMVDPLRPPELMFKVLRIEETFPQRQAIRFLASRLEIILRDGC